LLVDSVFDVMEKIVATEVCLLHTCHRSVLDGRTHAKFFFAFVVGLLKYMVAFLTKPENGD